MPFDFADRPAFRPIKMMQFVDLLGGKHACFPLWGKSGSPERCCWQDRVGRRSRPVARGNTTTWAGAKVLLARGSRPAPINQISAGKELKSKTKLLLA